MNQPIANPLLSVAQVAEMTGLCHRTVRLHIEAGKLRAIRFGRRCIRVREADLEAWIQSHTTTTETNMEAIA